MDVVDYSDDQFDDDDQEDDHDHVNDLHDDE